VEHERFFNEIAIITVVKCCFFYINLNFIFNNIFLNLTIIKIIPYYVNHSLLSNPPFTIFINYK